MSQIHYLLPRYHQLVVAIVPQILKFIKGDDVYIVVPVDYSVPKSRQNALNLSYGLLATAQYYPAVFPRLFYALKFDFVSFEEKGSTTLSTDAVKWVCNLAAIFPAILFFTAERSVRTSMLIGDICLDSQDNLSSIIDKRLETSINIFAKYLGNKYQSNELYVDKLRRQCSSLKAYSVDSIFYSQYINERYVTNCLHN